jgi:hypothetical protein
MNTTWFLQRILNQKRALEKNLAAGAAPGAFALSPPEQHVILFFVEIRADETADLPRRLPRAKLDSR